MQIKKYKYTIIAVLLLVSSAVLQGQEKKLNSADESFEEYAFIDAQQIYLKVAKNGYKSPDLYKKLGDSYYFNADLKEASLWYGQLYTDYPDEMESEYLFRYAQSLKSVNEYTESDKVMETFDQIVGKKERRAVLFDKERNYLDFIEMQSGRFMLSEVGVNTSFSDFAPSFRQGEIVFASSRGKSVKKVIHGWNERPFLDLFTAAVDNKSLVGVTKLKGKANTKFHESSSSFSKDGNTMYFTRNNYSNKKLKKDKGGTTLLKLYRSKYRDGKWQEAEELPFNSDEYSVAHPALNMDDSKLYFASDMPGGKGLSDLYVVDINADGSFGEPRNLGANINTEGRETFPYISNVGRLYLASDGHVGLGGLDIFVAVPSGNSYFEKPINVGEPVNSRSDDFTFILNEDTKIGYFATNRPGGMGDDDIYSFVQTDELITRCKQYVTGLITDASTRSPLSNATVTLFDGEMKEITDVVTDVAGKYKFTLECDKEYVIRGSKPEYKSTEVELETDYQFEYENNMPLQLVTGSDNPLNTVGANIGDDLAKLLKLQPIYFDLDKSNIRPDAEVELQKVIAAMQQYPQLKIDVRSHTDSRADDNYNMKLSERRANSTMKYIREKGGVPKDRISGRGYGESSLVNECANDANCNEEMHQLNRRSEFIILE